MNDTDIRTELSKDIVALIQKSPYYGHISLALVKEIDYSLPAAAGVACYPKLRLVINPDLWFKELPQHRIGLLQHELLHIILKHLIRLAKLPNHTRANFAADLVVNQLIDVKELPDWVLQPSKFNFPKNLLAEEYYDLLTEEMCGQIKSTDVHFYIDSNSESSSTEYTIAEVLIDETLREAAAKCQGNVPGNIKELIKYRSVNYVTWQTHFRRVIGNSGRSAVTYTKKRISNRFDVRPGIKLGGKGSVLLVVDSSGSISKQELEVFMSECWKASSTNLADIYTIICDADIQEIIYPFKKITEIKGRGGTDFRKPIEWALNTQEKHPPISLIVYLTDGQGTYPETRPYIPILWVLTNETKTVPPFGDVIRLPNLGETNA